MLIGCFNVLCVYYVPCVLYILYTVYCVLCCIGNTNVAYLTLPLSPSLLSTLSTPPLLSLSLTSSSGHEWGMLEDLMAAVEYLGHVEFTVEKGFDMGGGDGRAQWRKVRENENIWFYFNGFLW